MPSLPPSPLLGRRAGWMGTDVSLSAQPHSDSLVVTPQTAGIESNIQLLIGHWSSCVHSRTGNGRRTVIHAALAGLQLQCHSHEGA
mgnify:CR=1 FL=1